MGNGGGEDADPNAPPQNPLPPPKAGALGRGFRVGPPKSALPPAHFPSPVLLSFVGGCDCKPMRRLRMPMRRFPLGSGEPDKQH